MFFLYKLLREPSKRTSYTLEKKSGYADRITSSFSLAGKNLGDKTSIESYVKIFNITMKGIVNDGEG